MKPIVEDEPNPTTTTTTQTHAFDWRRHVIYECASLSHFVYWRVFLFTLAYDVSASAKLSIIRVREIERKRVQGRRREQSVSQSNQTEVSERPRIERERARQEYNKHGESMPTSHCVSDSIRRLVKIEELCHRICQVCILRPSPPPFLSLPCAPHRPELRWDCACSHLRIRFASCFNLFFVRWVRVSFRWLMRQMPLSLPEDVHHHHHLPLIISSMPPSLAPRALSVTLRSDIIAFKPLRL